LYGLAVQDGAGVRRVVQGAVHLAAPAELSDRVRPAPPPRPPRDRLDRAPGGAPRVAPRLVDDRRRGAPLRPALVPAAPLHRRARRRLPSRNALCLPRRPPGAPAAVRGLVGTAG